ncbi:MAG: phosphomannomutase/phosphoglucomutase [Firmicutes bacterium]|nr:phosphomannomutase/phosphoglucomutase [Bacillota bacterium]
MIKDYSKLQNGSDIRGIAIDGVEGEKVNLDREAAERIGAAFVKWLAKRKGVNADSLFVAAGRDPRVSGPALMEGLMRGFGSQGCRTCDFGLASTPAMFMATVFEDFACDGTVMITASHLPYNRNGFKFFTRDGGLDKGDIREILIIAGEEEVPQDVVITDSEKADIIGPYAEHLRKIIIDGVNDGDRPLEGMKITVDAGNGSGGFYASEVLAPLGADVSSGLYLEPDGMFPNHQPNPENKDAMAAISSGVLNAKADFGLIFDTDVDRSAAVDGNGREIARDGIVAMAAALIAEDYPGSTVVTDSITGRQLTEFIEKKLGLKHLRFRRGYRNVINKAIELNEKGTDSQLAIETSGHGAFKENYFLDDGAYLAAKVVIKAALLHREGKSIDSVLEGLEYPAEEKEIRIPVKGEDFGEYADKVLKELEDYAAGEEGLSLEEPNYEGVRINFGDFGWCLLRKSLHDPIMPLNIASDKTGGCEEIREILMRFLSKYDRLDTEV